MKFLLIGNGAFSKAYQSTLLRDFPNVSFDIATRNDWKEKINEGTNGVFVITHPDSHVQISKFALERNIPVMCEKPLAFTVKECEELLPYTAPILINHIHLFSDAYQDLKTKIKPYEITSIFSIGSGNNPPRAYSRLFDYGPHDISLILDLAQEFPWKIKCSKSEYGQSFHINLAFEGFDSLSIIGYSENRTRYLNVNEVYGYDGRVKEFPLTNAIKVFIDAIQGKPDYRLGLGLSLNVMRVLEECNKQVNDLI